MRTFILNRNSILHRFFSSRNSLHWRNFSHGVAWVWSIIYKSFGCWWFPSQLLNPKHFRCDQFVTHYLRLRTANARLAVTAVNPDVFGNAWSQNPRLLSISLLYRKAGTFIWSTASDANGPVLFAVTIASVRLWTPIVAPFSFCFYWLSLF